MFELRLTIEAVGFIRDLLVVRHRVAIGSSSSWIGIDNRRIVVDDDGVGLEWIAVAIRYLRCIISSVLVLSKSRVTVCLQRFEQRIQD